MNIQFTEAAWRDFEWFLDHDKSHVGESVGLV
jgi:hypothetical protein